jgi:hypothetical protein
MRKTNLLAILTLAATPALLHAQTVSTPIVGFEKRNFVSGTTGHGVGFVLSSKFQGTASSVTSNSLSVSSPSFTASQFALSGGLPTHYIQITSGAQSGLVVDIIGNTTSSLTVGSGDLAFSGTPNFVIRPHVLASTLFKENTSLADDSDTLTLFNSDGSTTTLAWSSASSTGWIDPVSLDPVDAVIYPGQGFLLNTSGSGNFTASGVVNPSSTIVPLYAGKVNLVSLSNPSSAKDLQSINLGANLEAENDTIGTFSADGYLSQDSAYTWNGSNGGGFVDPNSLVPASGVNVGGTSVLIVNSTFDTSWSQPSPLAP